MSDSAALACTEPPERAEYAIHHEIYGEVGRHVIDFSCEGDDLVVETTIEGEVKILMMPLFKRDGTYREVWRDGRLIASTAISSIMARRTRYAPARTATTP